MRDVYIAKINSRVMDKFHKGVKFQIHRCNDERWLVMTECFYVTFRSYNRSRSDYGHDSVSLYPR